MATMLSLASLMTAATPQSLAPVPQGTMHVQKGDFVMMAVAMRKAFLKVRGPDSSDKSTAIFPKTTNKDALSIARYWTEATRRFKKGATKTGQPKRWLAYANSVSGAATTAKAPDTPFEDNYRLWREVGSIAGYLSAMRGPTPSKWDYAWDSIKESAGELPNALAGAGNAAGRVIASPVAGISSALGINSKTLLTGAALVGVSVFVTSRILK